jgi:hypothetical protein
MIIRTPPKLTNRSSYIEYLEVKLWSWLKELTTGLLKIDFEQNFQAFIVRDLVIKAGEEVAISNQFDKVYPGLIPSGRIIIRQQGDANIIDGVKPWTTTHLYLQNPSLNDATVSVFFFK